MIPSKALKCNLACLFDNLVTFTQKKPIMILDKHFRYF